MLRSIDLRLRERLKDKEFRIQWYRSQLETSVPDIYRELREARKMTQQELAERAHMKQSAISRFEKSTEANWNFETLTRLAEALDAQLVISLMRSEDVIARYEAKEVGGGTPRRSVVEVAAQSLNRNDYAASLWFTDEPKKPRNGSRQNFARHSALNAPSKSSYRSIEDKVT